MKVRLKDPQYMIVMIDHRFGGEGWEVSAKTGMNMVELSAKVVDAFEKAGKSM
jgi:hypothetical protein